MLDSLVRVSRRVGGAADLLATEIKSTRIPAARGDRSRGLAAREDDELHPGPRSADSGSSRQVPEKCSRRRSRPKRGVLADRARPGRPAANLNLRDPLREPLRLPLHSFTYSWTLSSKFFSTFPHGTCSLSVSGSYLALRGVYHALWAALPSNSTLGESRHNASAVLRAYHPLWAVAPVKVDLDRPTRREEAPPNTTFRATWMADGSVLGSARFIRHY